jgi:hypothetical protein
MPKDIVVLLKFQYQNTSTSEIFIRPNLITKNLKVIFHLIFFVDDILLGKYSTNCNI